MIKPTIHLWYPKTLAMILWLNIAMFSSPALSADNPAVSQPANQSMPYLDQALILFTSVNGVIIVCGVILIFVRGRLNRQSSNTLTHLKASSQTTQMFKSSRDND